MKIKVPVYFFIPMLFLYGISNAQNLPEQDCIAAIPVCQDTFVQTIPYSGSGLNSNEINGVAACGGEINSVWYSFTIQSSGKLCFLITPALNNDYDWHLYNLTNAACSDIYSDTSLNVLCNSSGQTGAQTGASDNITGNSITPCIPVNAGESYVLNVNKFDAVDGGYSLDFTESTAQIYDIVPPQLLSVSTPASCGDTQITVIFSEKILCSSVQSPDFILSGPSGNMNITNATCSNNSLYDNQIILFISAAIAPVGNFSLTVNNASVEDLCGNLNTGDGYFSFSVTPYAIQTNTTPELCSTKNGTATANPSGGVSPYTYQWNTSPLQYTQIATGLSPGVFAVTVTDTVGCVSSAPANVGFDPGTNPPIAIINSFNNATCAGINNGNATVSASGGNAPFSFIWSTSPIQIGTTATGLGTGNYMVTATDSLGCYDTAIVVISGATTIDLAVFSANDTLCNGKTDTLTANATGGIIPYSYNWMGTGTNDTIFVTPVNTTVYSVFATDSMGCKSDTVPIVITVLPPISVNISSAGFICANDSLKLIAGANGGNGNYAYSWNNLATGNEIWVKPAANTTYAVTVTDNCTTIDGIASTNVTVGQLPQNITITANINSGCVPLEVKFLAEPYLPGYLYKWTFGDGTFPFPTTNDTISHTYNSDGCKDVKLVITTGENCSDSIYEPCKINPLPSPSADFIFSPENPTILNPLVNFSNQSSGAQRWQWNFGDTEISSLQNPFHEYSDSGNYTVKLVVENNVECRDSVEKIVTINYETAFYIPNCFTPDENGVNDKFGPSIEGINTGSYSMSIFNRNGQLVFRTENPNEKWNGKIKDAYAENGVYVYAIKYKPLKGREKKIYGSVTLLK